MTRFPDYRKGCVALGFSVLLIARSTAAQTVTGRVVAKADGAPVAGAIVALLDSTAKAVITRLATDSGSFVLEAPAAGRYSVRVERVGFRSSTSSPVTVRPGETVDVRMTVVSEGVSLRAIKVSADRRCVVRPQEGLAAARLWDEARKALSATQLTQLAQAAARTRRDPHRFLVRWRKFSRDLDPLTLNPLKVQQFELEGETVTPFVSEDPETLDRYGYVVGARETGTTYYAPDATVLLSDRFLDSHCFRVQAPEHDRRDDVIGLAFEPTSLTSDGFRGQNRVDVRGVLWLDRATAELRYMEYSYVNLPADIAHNALGGQLEFRPMPDGRWIVWRWYIRMPHLEARRKLVDPTVYARSETHLEITSLREDGAEVLEVMPPGARSRRFSTIHGSVYDSLHRRPLVGVRVFLSGTTFAALTSNDGSYTIESIPPAVYKASVLAPQLDTLLLEPPARELALGAGRDEQVDFAIPALRTLSARLCPEGPAADSLPILVGVIRDTSDATAPDATVRAEWVEFSAPTSNHLAARPMATETKTILAGRYALCGLPTDTRVTVKARRGGNTAVVGALHFGAGEVRRLDLTLRKP